MDSNTKTIIFLISILMGIIILGVIVGLALGQTTTTTGTGTTGTTGTATPIPPTTPTIASNPTPGGTPTVATQQEIATTDDLSSQFNALLGTSGATVAGGIGALWAIIRKKTSKIDNALRGSDFDHRDLMIHLNTFFEAAKANPTKTPGELLSLPAFRDKVLMNKALGEAWAIDFEEYDEWFNQRYMVNKT